MSQKTMRLRVDMAVVGKDGRVRCCLNYSLSQLRSLADKSGRVGGGCSEIWTVCEHRSSGDILVRFGWVESRLSQTHEVEAYLAQQSSPRGSGASSEDGMRGSLQVSRGGFVPSCSVFRPGV